MRRTLALALLLAANAVPAATTVEPFAFRTYDGREVKAERVIVEVPESRAKADSPKRKIVAVRLKSTAEKPAAPIVFLMGGPGIPGNVMAKVPPYFDLFSKLTAISDVLIYDYRGVGMSEPLLDCKYLGALPGDAFLHERAAIDYLRQSVRWCAAEWKKRGLDARDYDAETNADDVDDLRAAVGAPTLNLLAFSYGTDIALTAIRRHPDHLARVVLASTNDPDAGLKRPALWDLQLRRVSRFTPDFDKNVRDAAKKLDASPITIDEMPVGSFGLRFVLRSMMSDARAFLNAPPLVAALMRGDSTLLAKAIGKLREGLPAAAMSIATDCTRPHPPARQAQVAAEAKEAFFRDINLQWDDSICREVVSDAMLHREDKRMWSTLPVLFISGDTDPNTPAGETETLRFGFPNSTHVIIENGWHESLPSPQVQELVAAFFSGTDVRGRAIRFDPPKIP